MYRALPEQALDDVPHNGLLVAVRQHYDRAFELLLAGALRDCVQACVNAIRLIQASEDGRCQIVGIYVSGLGCEANFRLGHYGLTETLAAYILGQTVRVPSLQVLQGRLVQLLREAQMQDQQALQRQEGPAALALGLAALPARLAPPPALPAPAQGHAVAPAQGGAQDQQGAAAQGRAQAPVANLDELDEQFGQLEQQDALLQQQVQGQQQDAQQMPMPQEMQHLQVQREAQPQQHQAQQRIPEQAHVQGGHGMGFGEAGAHVDDDDSDTNSMCSSTSIAD